MPCAVQTGYKGATQTIDQPNLSTEQKYLHISYIHFIVTPHPGMYDTEHTLFKIYVEHLLSIFRRPTESHRISILHFNICNLQS